MFFQNAALSTLRKLATDDSVSDINYIIATAKHPVGNKYGIAKLMARLADGVFQVAHVFRRLTDDSDNLISSRVMYHVFADAGNNFGVEPGAAEPDDIWDFVTSHKDIFECVHPLMQLREQAR